MAKLSARGRKELARVEREESVLTKPVGGVDWRRNTYALMSDGTILNKYDVRFVADSFNKEPRKHSYGWTVWKKVKPEVTAEKFVAYFIKRGFQQVQS